MINQISKLKIIAKRYFNFDFCFFLPARFAGASARRAGKAGIFDIDQRGVALLLVMVLLSAMLSISVGIFNVVWGQIRLSGEVADSFIAFYAADEGIEKILYKDRISGSICPVTGASCHAEGPVNVDSGGCYSLRVSKVGSATEIITAGQYRCGVNPGRVVKRGFQVSY